MFDYDTVRIALDAIPRVAHEIGCKRNDRTQEKRGGKKHQDHGHDHRGDAGHELRALPDDIEKSPLD